MSDFGTKLQQYAEGSDKCQHPIKDVVEIDGGEFCQACNTFLKAKPIQAPAPDAKDARIAELEAVVKATQINLRMAESENAYLRAELEIKRLKDEPS